MANEQTLTIENVLEHFDQAALMGACSVGLHPWRLTNDPLAMHQLTAAAMRNNVLAIGECGLDKVCATDWVLQKKVFEQQIRLANELHKPLIIHCVRAFDETIDLLKKTKSMVPVIFHGYNKKAGVALQLIQNGYYLSFGAALLHPSSPAATVFSTMAADKYFLETDDAAITIEQVYKKAAEIRNTDVDTIILQVRNNFHTVFKQL